ncbi:MAG: glycosyltransferase [Candidatus Levybacteria bacterium]|nr:glycosyltransferase [Candidatus Levybacteria bacterium]MSU26113.1 glycosyltransferase [Candidatus Levybacteria bacterium]
MKISIIIPNYNGSMLLKKNIPAVINSIKKYKNSEIIIIDDCSVDNSLSVLNSFKNNIIIIENNKNIGFADSVNIAVKKSIGDIIILLNSDVRPDLDFIKPLLFHFENEKVFAVGCLDKSIENGEIIQRGRGIGSWTRGFFQHSAGELDKKNTLWVSGGSGAFRKSIWEKLGGFSSAYYPFYWEDIDISYRAWKLGYEVHFEKQSKVIHEHEEGAIRKKFNSQYIKTTAYKNQFIFVWKNITDVELCMSHALWLPYHFLIALKNVNLAFFIGFLKAFFYIPIILLENITLRNKKIISDKNILSLFKK